MSQSKYNQAVFVMTEEGIEQMTYAEYLCMYHNDETTSPRGIENRRFVKAVLLDEEGEIIESSREVADFYGYSEDLVKYAVYTWGVRGRGPAKLDSELFDTEEEAKDAVLDGMEYQYQHANYNYPQMYYTEQEAINDIVSLIAEEYDIDTEVAAHIYRKQQVVSKLRAEREQAQQARRAAERKVYIAESEALVSEKAANLTSIEGESYKDTCARLSAALGSKIDAGVFHSIVKSIRRR